MIRSRVFKESGRFSARHCALQLSLAFAQIVGPSGLHSAFAT